MTRLVPAPYANLGLSRHAAQAGIVGCPAIEARIAWRQGAITNRAWLDGDGPVAKAALRGQVRLRGDADAAPGSLVRLARVRTARSVADPHRSGVPRPGAAHRADRRRRPRRNRAGSDPLRDRPHFECRGALRGARDDLRPGPLRGRASGRVRPGAAPQGHGARWGGRRSSLSLARAVLLQGGRHGADVRHLSRVQ